MECRGADGPPAWVAGKRETGGNANVFHNLAEGKQKGKAARAPGRGKSVAGGRELPGRGGADGGASGAEAVAGAADGFEMGGRGAEFAADLHDVLVEGTARGKVVFAPYGVE